jgi:hypothetical protein
MPPVNLWAVLGAAAAAFLLGGLWYAPFLLGKAWQRAAQLSDEQIKSGNPAMIFGVSFLLLLLAAFVFALFLGPAPALPFALGAGLSAGLCWVAASLGVNYLFERKTLALFLVNGGYHTAQFTLYGLILGLWH